MTVVFKEALKKLVSNKKGTNREVLDKCYNDYSKEDTLVNLNALWLKITEGLLVNGISSKDLHHQIILLDTFFSKKDFK